MKPRDIWINALDIPSPGGFKIAHATLSGDKNENVHFREVLPTLGLKIIACSNFDNETVGDVLIAENIINKWDGDKMVKALNDSAFAQPHSTYFYKLVSSDYKLHEFQP